MSAQRRWRRIPVGVVVERRKAASQWIDFIWRPVAVLAGEPDTPPWTMLRRRRRARDVLCGRRRRSSCIARETANYRDNLASGSPALWVVLRATGAEPPYALVSRDRRSGRRRGHHRGRQQHRRAGADAGADPRRVAAFVAEHHVERGVLQAQARPRRSRVARAPRAGYGGSSDDDRASRKISWRAGRAANAKRERDAPDAPRRADAANAPTSPHAGQRRDAEADKRRPKRRRNPNSISRACRRSNSITAVTDIRAFLAPGVPAELTRAALRRAWSADPAIRDFVGLAENAWDFTDPTAMPGFGALPPGYDVKKLVAQIFGDGEKPADARGRSQRRRADPQASHDRERNRAAGSAGRSCASAGGEAQIRPARDCSRPADRAKRYCAARQ